MADRRARRGRVGGSAHARDRCGPLRGPRPGSHHACAAEPPARWPAATGVRGAMRPQRATRSPARALTRGAAGTATGIAQDGVPSASAGAAAARLFPACHLEVPVRAWARPRGSHVANEVLICMPRASGRRRRKHTPGIYLRLYRVGSGQAACIDLHECTTTKGDASCGTAWTPVPLRLLGKWTHEGM
jgi:hypothetical protein